MNRIPLQYSEKLKRSEVCFICVTLLSQGFGFMWSFSKNSMFYVTHFEAFFQIWSVSNFIKKLILSSQIQGRQSWVDWVECLTFVQGVMGLNPREVNGVDRMSIRPSFYPEE